MRVTLDEIWLQQIAMSCNMEKLHGQLALIASLLGMLVFIQAVRLFREMRKK